MDLLTQLRNLIEEPAPKFAFEISSSGLASWQQQGGMRFAAATGLEAEVDAEALKSWIEEITPAALPGKKAQPGKKGQRRAAALVLPDRCARVSLLDFDSFPGNAQEQLSLVRFRLKRTLPFDVETAVLRYSVRPAPVKKSGKAVLVTVAAIAVETLAPYEAAFRQAGFHPGFVTLSSLSMANLATPDSMIVRLSGETLSLSFFAGKEIALYRCLEVTGGEYEGIVDVLDPTLAYLEDEMKQRPAKIDLCGFGPTGGELKDHLEGQWRLPVDLLRSRHGAVESHNAGLLGYLEGAGVN
jgi:type IV pilus assembly protein PilM